MFRFLLKRISRRILNKQIVNYGDLFTGINNNKNKLILLDIGGAGGLQNRWKIFEKNIRSVFVEPDKRSFLELKNKGLEVISKAFWSKNTQKNFTLQKSCILQVYTNLTENI